MEIDWNQKNWEKKRIASAPKRGEWVWEPVKLDKKGGVYSPVGGRGATILRQGVYKCAFCKGVGEKPRGAKCSVCSGKGQVSVRPPAVVCAYCKGRGEERPRSNITCTACKGKGFVSVIEPIRECPHCHGKGKEPTNKLPCIVCGGKGVVSAKKDNREWRKAKPSFQSASSENSNTRKLVTPSRRPTGSEQEVLEVIQGLGKASRAVIGKRMGISSAYAELLCNSLIKSGHLSRTDRGLFALTKKGKEIFRKRRGI
ncbi:hypothetical protein HQ584_09335 [Patescibacteria group bacterium]|nr:hypothetical protein [Patescibacteria group bacterium]